MSRGVRVAIAGTGFIGAVHARSARLAGARLVGVAASSPESAPPRRGARSAPSARSTSPRSSSSADDVDVVHICTPNHLHVPLAEAALAAGKHVICEKPIAIDALARRRSSTRRRTPGRIAAVPFVYRYYPTVREARERVRAGETGPVRLIHGTYLQDWLLQPDDDNWRVDERPRRRLARVRRHRLALVRPGRVRLRPPHHAPVRAHADRAARARQGRGRTPRSSRRRRRRGPRGRHRGRRDRPVRDRPRRGRLDGHQPDLGRAARTACGSRSTAPRRRSRSTRRSRSRCGVGRREAATLDQARPRAPERRRRSATRSLPAGHPQGYADCFDAFVAEVYDAVASRRRRRRAAASSPTACAPRGSPTRCCARRARSAGSTCP